MEEFLEFNLNNYVHVKLHDNGWEYLFKERNKYSMGTKYEISMEHLKSKADKEGYIAFQAHDFIDTFGNHLHLGGRPPFDLNVRIKKTELKGQSKELPLIYNGEEIKPAADGEKTS